MVDADEIVACRFRYRDHAARLMCRRPQQHLPKGKIEPAEIFGVALVLQIVKNSHASTGTKNGGRKSRIEKDVEAPPRGLHGQKLLFPQNSRWPEASRHGLRLAMKILLAGNKILTRLQ